MRIYVASSREGIPIVKLYAAKLEAANLTITHKWWEDVEKEVSAGRSDSSLTRKELRPYAEADSDGIDDCDIFWLLAPESGGTGCWIELGLALNSSPRCPHVVVSGAWRRAIFASLECVEVFDEHGMALKAILEKGA